MNRFYTKSRLGLTLLIGMGMVLAVSQSFQAAHSAPPGQAALFSDNFEDGNSTGWSKSGGSWSVISDGSLVFSQSSTSSDAKAWAGSGWTSQAVEARVKPVTFNGSNRFAAVLARFVNSTNYYYLALRSNNTLELGRRVSGGYTALASRSFTVSTGTWYTVRLEANGTSLNGFVNGSLQLSASDSTFASGRAGLATLNTSARFDDVLVTGSGGGATNTPGPTSTPTRTNTPVGPTPTRTNTPTQGPSATPTRTPTMGPTQPVDRSLVGFAAVNALGQNGTTGGAGGPTVTVSNAADFLSQIAQAGPRVIQVSGMISLPGPMHDVTSDKTIIGIGSNSGISGGGLNIGLAIDDDITSPPSNAVHNVIVRNMRITSCPDDCVNVQMFSHHIWIDHNDFSNQVDGALDVKRGSDFVTISWNVFHDSDKNMLLGHDDSNGPQDIGRLRVSYHHNFFNGSTQRNPRVRFGEPVHVFNNYYLNITGYGVASQMNAGVLVENNYFDNVEKPTRIDVGGDEGRIVARGNINVNTEDPIVTNGSVQEASAFYSYSLDPAANVPGIVMNGAGVGKIN